jgi:anti-sigma factor RsiW
MLRLRAPDLQCRQAVELVTDYLEGSLTGRQRRRFEKHLRACDGCDAYLAQVRVTIATLGRVAPDDLEPDALDRLVDLFREYHAGDE